MDDLASAEGTEDNKHFSPHYWTSDGVKYRSVTKQKATEY